MVAQVRLNGRAGVVVSGGLGAKANSSLASVEFYDTSTGTWLQLPRLRRGRSGHTMQVSSPQLFISLLSLTSIPTPPPPPHTGC